METSTNSQGNDGITRRSIWETLTDDDLKEINSLGGGFKKCPSCKAPIDRCGGSNYINCTHCHKEFCWMCGKDWSLHQNYSSCPYYKPEEDPYSH
ncbi:E3 ubiquitin-protein ligase arih2 [Tritrichomonas musculus]|uniref:E3 ubiquitin-protein ligase arih2 n=1 Tax=Tritrichomonas musculus TaxID=1915356 RepID=A0ABR2H0A6_9EUKA